MKNLSLFFFVLIIGTNKVCNGQSPNLTPLLSSKIPQVKSVVRDVVREVNLDFEDLVLLFSVESKKVGFEVRIGVMGKKEIPAYLTIIDGKLKGVLQYNDIDILVFGDNWEEFFERRGVLLFEYINKEVPKLNQVGNIPPPIFFDPDIWVYKIKKRKFKLLYRGKVGVVKELEIF